MPYTRDNIPYGPSDTSRKAAESQCDKALSDRMRILEHIERQWSTSDEIEYLFDLAHQTASARIKGLHDDALIGDSGRRRLTRRGRAAIVWKPGRCYCFDSLFGRGVHYKPRRRIS